MASFLEAVRETTLRDVEAAIRSGAAARAAEIASARRVEHPFTQGLRDAQGVAVIAEIKRASPSAGAICAELDAPAQARRYAAGGAAAISVLTEPRWFGGSLDDLEQVSAAVPCPTLRKDFILDPAQIDLASARGAAAILLIAAFVPPQTLESLLACARSRGLDALVEAHDEGEARLALEIGAEVIGVNARNLRTLEVDRGAVLRLGSTLAASAASRGVILVAESGIRDPEHAREAERAGYRAVLVGESLVRHPDPAAAVRALSQARACPPDDGPNPQR